jgi:16S rRNA (guanine527-N7)-methyltransferase
MTEDEATATIASAVSRETLERLTIFATLLIKWQAKINLVSPSTIPALWTRHMLDSAQLMQHIPANASRWLDLGSGGGFPGLVCAAIAHDHHPSLQITLVESDQRKAAFLREAARQMGISAAVHCCRIADLPPHMADVLSARALAPLPFLLDMAHIHLATSGICLFQKGARYGEECEAAKQTWHFNYDIIPSVTDEAAVVFRIKELHHV